MFPTPYEAVIGLEVHATLKTRSKMFCACAVVNNTVAPPNSAVCPVCAGMPATGKPASEIVEAQGLKQVSDEGFIAEIVRQMLEENPGEAASFKSGKETTLNWLFGQVMKKAAGRANPSVALTELERRLRS